MTLELYRCVKVGDDLALVRWGPVPGLGLQVEHGHQLPRQAGEDLQQHRQQVVPCTYSA